MSYIVRRHVSTRAEPDAEGWLEYPPGTTVPSFPKHIDVAELLRIGAIARAPARRAKVKEQPDG